MQSRVQSAVGVALIVVLGIFLAGVAIVVSEPSRGPVNRSDTGRQPAGHDSPSWTQEQEGREAIYRPGDHSDWPEFYMRYRISEALQNDAQVELQTLELELHYQNERQWRKLVVEGGGAGEDDGTVYMFDGDISTITTPNVIDPETGKPVVSTFQLPSILAPERWLRPDWADLLVERYQYRMDGGADENIVEYTRETANPCDNPDLKALVPEVCSQAAGVELVETMVMRTDVQPPMPVAGTTTVGGELIWSFTVAELVVDSDGADVTLIDSE